MNRLGFFAGTLLGMCIPLLLLGGEFKADKDAKVTESFYGGVIVGVLLDIALVVGLIFLFRR